MTIVVRRSPSFVILAVAALALVFWQSTAVHAQAFTPSHPTAVGPNSRASAIAWMDANNAADLTMAAGGSPVDAGKVSGFGHFGQSTSASQPLWSQHGGPNGEGCLVFMGTQTMTDPQSDSLFSSVLTTASSYTLTFVFRGFGAGAQLGGNVSLWNQGTSLVDQAADVLVNTGNLKRYLSGPSTGSGQALLSQRWYVAHYVYDATTGKESLYLSGQLVTSSTGAANRETYNTANAWTVGASSTNMYLSQIVVDNVALSTSQVQSDVAYWHNRFAGSGSTMPLEIFCLGDSRTIGVDTQRNEGALDEGAQSYPYILTSLLQQKMTGLPFERLVNLGVGGTQPGQGSSNGLYMSIEGLNPLYRQVCIIGPFAYNGWNVGTTESQTWTDEQALANAMINLWAYTVICTDIDAKDSTSWQTYRNTFNSSVAATYPTTPANGYWLCDLGSVTHLGNLGDSLNTSYFGPDQVHLFGATLTNQAQWAGGYYLIAQTLEPIAQQAAALLMGVSSAPVFSSASINSGGTTLTVNLSASGTPPTLPASGATGFTLSGGLIAHSLSTGTRTAGSTSTSYTFTVSPAIVAGEGVTLSYSGGNVTDSAASPAAMASFSGALISNGSTVHSVRVLPRRMSLLTSPAAARKGTQVCLSTR